MTTSESTPPDEPVHERPLLDEKALRAETDWGVGLARVSGLETTEKHRPFVYDPYTAYLYLFAIFIVGWGLHFVLRVGMPLEVVAAAVLVIILIAVILINAREKTPVAPFSDLSTLSTVRAVADQNRRVWCVGQDRPLSLVLKDGPIQDEAFEPMVLSIWRPLRGRRTIAIGFAVGFATFFGFVVLLIQFPILKQVQTLAFWASFILGALATSFLSRRYSRLAPGTLELMEFPFLGRGTPRVTRYDLRTSRVIVDLNANMVYITEPNGTLHDVRIEDWRTRFAFARAVLAAAVSTAQVPELPRDRFTD